MNVGVVVTVSGFVSCFLSVSLLFVAVQMFDLWFDFCCDQ